jgi:hypothetical protein
MAAVYVVIRYIAGPHGLFDYWLFELFVLFAWMGFGLLLSIHGLACKGRAGRVSALLALAFWGFFMWCMLYPAMKPARIGASSRPNKSAEGKAGIAPRLTIRHHWTGVPEPACWLLRGASSVGAESL